MFAHGSTTVMVLSPHAMMWCVMFGQAAQSRPLAAKVLKELSRDPVAGKKVADLLREGDGGALKAVVSMLNNKEDMESCAAAASLISSLPQNDSKLNHLLVQVRTLWHCAHRASHQRRSSLCALRLTAAEMRSFSSTLLCMYAMFDEEAFLLHCPVRACNVSFGKWVVRVAAQCNQHSGGDADHQAGTRIKCVGGAGLCARGSCQRVGPLYFAQ